jgi:hypothetical protein
MLRVNDTLQLDGGVNGGGVHELVFCCGDALGHEGGAVSAKVNMSSFFIEFYHHSFDSFMFNLL